MAETYEHLEKRANAYLAEIARLNKRIKQLEDCLMTLRDTGSRSEIELIDEVLK